jgi:(1->4)-alpha-D-glucan 1-alpha-D-glucosylmutase
MMVSRVPLATYRLQLTKAFGFADAAALVPYLKELGISHLYASPFLAARAGSTHGYDIVDYARLNEELGGEAGFAELSNALRPADLGLILDFVPNHMGIGHADNTWWLDVLEWGEKSPHAASFDIDWHGLPYRTQPGVLLPILGRPYGEVLESGEIALRFDSEAGSFAAWYFDHKLPINPRRYAEILRTVVAAAGAQDTPAGQALLAIAHDHRDPREPSYSSAAGLKRRLAGMTEAHDVMVQGLQAYDARREDGALALHRLLERQNYRVAYWRVAFSAINYRRFFDINDLAGVRPERPATFMAMHVLVARLVAEGELHGIRLDHIDGLWDPAQYTRRLVELIRRVRPQSRRDGFYILIEKILSAGEAPTALRGVDGNTGYERLNLISRVLLDDNGLPVLERTWREFTGEGADFAGILRSAKLRVLDTMLASEFTVLTRALGRIAAGHLSSRDFTPDRLRAALQAYVLEFPAYRTYITATRISQPDRDLIGIVIARARAAWAGPDPEIFEFLRDAITADLALNRGYSALRVRNFALKLQQFTGPLMAKSLEDTAFYRYPRLLALNEVGGEPAHPVLAVGDFHHAQQRLRMEMPHGLIATATHDTKRGEDARMRILALAEIAEDWDAAVTHWREMNAPLLWRDGDTRAPTANHEYMLYQTLIGAWPFEPIDRKFTARIQAYALKAAREGKRSTSWTEPQENYEVKLAEFVAAVLDSGRSTAFLHSVDELVRRTALLGALNSLSQLTLKLTLPGVPDFYQGTEVWDLSLVDPDNRRPVDFAKRQAMLKQTAEWAGLVENWKDGRIKLELMRRLLTIRHQFAALFRDGDYTPLAFEGADAARVIGFSRTHKRQRVIVAVSRHFSARTDGGRQWPSGWDVRPMGEPLADYKSLLQPELSPQRNLFGTIPVAVFAT